METVQKFLPQFETHVDYEGQKLAELLAQSIIAAFAVIGFLWGWYWQRFSETFIVFSAGVILAALLCIPPWPFYRRHSIKWLKKKNKKNKKNT
eukprot:m.357891 g.357891  ORF g.357891 m.357891 type:complete len:93 (-) comp17978_c0_seq1:448-726(-)